MPDRKEFPIGLGATELQKNRETLPAVEVVNEVIWVNPAFEGTLPFDVKEGEPTKLGMFLTDKPQEREKIYNLEVKFGHGRSGILGRVAFRDTEGSLYRDIDSKGVGHVLVTPDLVEVDEIYREQFNGDKIYGVLDLGYANHDKKFAEKFIQLGIRTYRPVTIIKLKELVLTGGERVSVTEARKRNLIRGDETPVVEIRAWGTRSRIGDMSSRTLEDARLLVAQELERDPNTFAMEDYSGWFVDTVAVNIARMHAAGFVHAYLTEHNITLDARIVDLDSVKTLTEQQKNNPEYSYDDDCAMAEQSVVYFSEHLLRSPYGAVLIRFREVYKQELERLKKEAHN